MTPELLAGLIERYASFGNHRTGGAADEAVSGWICAWLRKRGVEARSSEFSFPRVESRAALVEAGGLKIEGTVLYDSVATGAHGVSGRLAIGSAAGRVAVMDRVEDSELDAVLDSDVVSRPKGIVVISGDPDGFVALRNAERMARPYPVPAVQIAARDAAPLLRLAAAGQEARLVSDFDVIESRASNVVAEIKAERGEGLVVLMTPKSGWFACAAERGGGVAIAMLLAVAISRIAERRKDVLVLFTSGHELAHRGLVAYLADNPELRTRADLWLHLGASIGARHPTRTRLFSRVDAWREWFMPVLERHGAGPVLLAERDVRPHGESREIFDRPFISVAGGHSYFHSPRDVPEVAVDAARVMRFGAAFRELLEKAVR